MKDPRNNNLKLKAQKPQAASSNNYSGSIEVSEKSCKEKRKKFLTEKQNKRKNSKSTLATQVHTTNSNLTGGIKKLDTI